MKYIKRIILFAVMLIALGISNVHATSGSVTSDGVRVRKGPSTTSDIVAVLNKDASVEIIEETSDGWYKIKYTATSNFEGYIRKDLIKADGTVTATQSIPTTEPSTKPTETPVESPAPAETQTPPPQEETPKENLLGEKKLNDQAKIYILPVTASSIKDEVSKDTEVSVQEIAGSFAYIKYNNKFGWVKTNLLAEKTVQDSKSSQTTSTTTTTTTTTNSVTEKKGYVNVSQAIIRKSATTSSEMVASLNLNSEVTIIGEESDFYKIRINNKEAYIAKRLISDTKQTTNRGSSPREEQTPTPQTPATPVATEPPKATLVPTSAVGEQMAQMAKSYIGYKYVYGGASPSTGFDCSGLVYYICGQLGYKVNRTADNQANNGVYVDKTNLQPGDLVFFSNYKTHTEIGHVGIYIGDNQFVHASTPTTGVIVSSLNDAEYVRRYVTARRIGA